MTRIVPLSAAALALSIVATALATSGNTVSTVSTYKAALTPGAEVPKAKAPAGARGAFTATVTANAGVRSLSWKLTFGGLSGKAVAAHIHKGKPGVAGGVLVGLCGPCKTGQTGKLKITKGTADALARGLAYVNVHTAKNAGGEERGQVKLIKTAEVEAPVATEPTTTTPGGGYGGSGAPGVGY
jgi:hypothetical protein